MITRRGAVRQHWPTALQTTFAGCSAGAGSLTTNSSAANALVPTSNPAPASKPIAILFMFHLLLRPRSPIRDRLHRSRGTAHASGPTCDLCATRLGRGVLAVRPLDASMQLRKALRPGIARGFCNGHRILAGSLAPRVACRYSESRTSVVAAKTMAPSRDAGRDCVARANTVGRGAFARAGPGVLQGRPRARDRACVHAGPHGQWRGP